MNKVFLAHSDRTYLHYLETVFRLKARQLHTISGKSLNGIESLKMLLEQDHEIALLGADLLHLTGVDIAKVLHRKERGVKCILIFPKRRPELLTEVFLQGVSGILYKGDDATTVLKGIEEVLSGKTFTSSSFS